MAASKSRIDVFISSTSIDLPEHRAAVIQAITALRLTPLGMEIWPKTGERPVDKCRQMVFDSEVFIGIYAYRYGWRPDGPGTSSITEMEYDWAGEVKRDGRPIPRLCFLMADSHPWPEDRKEHEAQADLDRFKARVKADEVGFFTTPDDLARQVTVALVPFVKRTNQRSIEPYLRWLHEESKRSGLLRVLNPRDATRDSRSITVDQVYTPLNVQHAALRDDHGRVLRLEALLDLSYRLGDRKESERSNLTAMEAANLFEHLVLLGDPGSGKSTLLQFLTVGLTGHLLDPDSDWIATLEAQGWEQGERLPVVVTLRDFAQDIPEGTTTGKARLLFDHLERQLARSRLEECFPDIQAALGNGSAVVLLDGLDEVPDERRELVRQTISEFIQPLDPKTRVIVTCRILSYANEDWKLPGMTEETIAPFEREQIEQFVRAWYAALHALGEIDDEKAERRAEELIAEMGNEQVGKIAQNPMLLTVMAIVHNHQGALPKEIARLYQDCVELLMLKWRPTAATSLLSALGVRDVDLDQMLEQIAFDAHSKQAERQGAADIPEEDILGIARTRLGSLDRAETFCAYVERQAGLLVGRGGPRAGWRVFSFPHRTFQEFLAGRYAANNDFPEIAPELAERGANWREALRLATGHLVFNQGQTTLALGAIDTLCPPDETPQSEMDWQKVWLAGEMLTLIALERAEPTRKGPGLIRRVRGRLADLLDQGRLTPVERAAAGRALGRLGDPRPGVGLRPDGLPDIAWAEEIPAGRYRVGDMHEYCFEPHEVMISQPFRLSKYPITNQQFAAFVNAPDRDDEHWWKGIPVDWERYPRVYNTRTIHEPSFPEGNNPRECVSWFLATAFCRWLTHNYRQSGLLEETMIIELPHEHEWEIGARGNDRRDYACIGPFDSDKANTEKTGIGRTCAVGMFPEDVSPYGALDMTGNVSEWCNDPSYDPAELDMNGDSVWHMVHMRGGSWSDGPDKAIAAIRVSALPVLSYITVGFRLACHPQSQSFEICDNESV